MENALILEHLFTMRPAPVQKQSLPGIKKPAKNTHLRCHLDFKDSYIYTGTRWCLAVAWCCQCCFPFLGVDAAQLMGLGKVVMVTFLELAHMGHVLVGFSLCASEFIDTMSCFHMQSSVLLKIHFQKYQRPVFVSFYFWFKTLICVVFL